MRRIRPLRDGHSVEWISVGVAPVPDSRPATRVVTRGLRRFGMSGAIVARLFAAWPSAGFHWRLMTLTLDRVRSHPLTPLPMVRL
jgi:hypothetical protein